MIANYRLTTYNNIYAYYYSLAHLLNTLRHVEILVTGHTSPITTGSSPYKAPALTFWLPCTSPEFPVQGRSNVTNFPIQPSILASVLLCDISILY